MFILRILKWSVVHFLWKIAGIKNINEPFIDHQYCCIYYMIGTLLTEKLISKQKYNYRCKWKTIFWVDGEPETSHYCQKENCLWSCWTQNCLVRKTGTKQLLHLDYNNKSHHVLLTNRFLKVLLIVTIIFLVWIIICMFTY